MRAQEKQFTNVRVRLQRLGELHAHYGWVERYQSGFISVWCLESEEIQPGARFFFEVYGMDSTLTFEAVMEGYADSRPSTHEMCYGFQIGGEVRAQSPKEDCRRFVGSVKTEVIHRNQEVEAQLIDISSHGAGVRMPVRPRIGDPLHLKLRVPGRKMIISGHVRYAKRDSTKSEMYRVGVRFEVLTNQDQVSWQEIVQAA